ncbi:helix-turn-helix domain-containing protein [Paenibacillus piri]|uniref:helix-turn-helix domain-containing protein n=1 Tax=Paenibacillus piri TaxID=2547395 RepID=UPI0014042D74|nr:helix-turn-helix transcriptional regulator [Paenibacillus piri]
MGQVERGEKNPTIKTLEKIAGGLDTSLETLIINIEKQESSMNDKNAVLTILSPDDLRQLIVETIRNNGGDSIIPPSKCNKTNDNADTSTLRNIT